MDREAAAHFIAGTLAGWMGFSYIDLPHVKKTGLRKPKAPEREVLDRFGENIMLAYDLAVEELEKIS